VLVLLVLGMAVDEPPIAPQQALAGLEALQGYTLGCAAAIGDPPRRIVAGAPAHLTGFAADPVDTPPDELLTLPVWLTVVDGDGERSSRRRAVSAAGRAAS
jgi:predicted amidohydrolase YtcJ